MEDVEVVKENIEQEEIQKKDKINKKLKKKVRKRNIFIIILIIIIILLLLVRLRGCGGDTIARYIPWIAVNDEYIITPEDKENVDIPLVTDFSVSSSTPIIKLFNPDTNANKFYLLYKIYLKNGEINSLEQDCSPTDEDELIYTSNMIKPSDTIDVNIKELLPKGRHNLIIKTEVYDMETMELKNNNLATLVSCYVRR